MRSLVACGAALLLFASRSSCTRVRHTGSGRHGAPLVERLTLPLPHLHSSISSVSALCGRPPASLPRAAAAPVLLLHGARFSASTWDELGTLAALAADGRVCCALDLAEALALPPSDAARFLPAVLDALGWSRAFVVAPSASGRLLWPFLASPAAGSRLSGAVSVAAVAFPEHGAAVRASASARTLPALIIWGERRVPRPPTYGYPPYARVGQRQPRRCGCRSAGGRVC
jgi:pimeloyl-ACP methyl ester carboxylesterase